MISYKDYYSGRFDVSDLVSYPYGAGKDRTAPGNGSPWLEGMVSDIIGFRQALVVEAGIVPSGNPESATASDCLDSIKQIISDNVPNASETVKGRIEIATQTEVDDGGDDFRAITSLKLKNTFVNSLTTNGYQKLPGGLIIQWGTSASIPPTTPTAVSFNIAYPTACSNVVITSLTSTGIGQSHDSVVSKTTTTFTMANAAPTATSFYWSSTGY